MKLKDKVAIVTGAARGIGEAVAYDFVKEGAVVAICDVDQQALDVAASRIEAMDGRCLAVCGDVSDREFVRSMIDETKQKLGGLDILVNNAGIIRDAMGHKMTEQQWDQVIDVNLKGVFNCLQFAMMHMRGAGSGSIINMSSISRYGNPGQLNYSASKAGVAALTRTAAKELAAKGVRVNCVAPGFIDTDMLASVPRELLEGPMLDRIPLHRMGSPSEIATVVSFLASEEASFITGQTINVDGGAYMQ